MGIETDNNFSVVDSIYSPAQIKAEQLKELPNDAASHENASIYHRAGKIVLVTDPHQLFVRWMTATVDPEQLTVVRSPEELQAKEGLYGTLLIIHNETKLNQHYERLLSSKQTEHTSRINIISRRHLEVSQELSRVATKLDFAVTRQALSDYFTQCIVKE